MQVYNKVSKKLEITTTPNQNPITGNLVPLLGIDVWEHVSIPLNDQVKGC